MNGISVSLALITGLVVTAWSVDRSSFQRKIDDMWMLHKSAEAAVHKANAEVIHSCMTKGTMTVYNDDLGGKWTFNCGMEVDHE